MNAGQIITTALQLAQQSTVDATLRALGLSLLNGIRLDAERKHDFQLSRRRGYVTVVPATGGSLVCSDSPSVVNTNVNVKSIVFCHIQADDDPSRWLPAKHYLRESVANQDIIYDRNRVDMSIGDNRYPTDSQAPYFGPGARIVIEGRTMYFEPDLTATKIVRVYASTWLGTYANDSSTDFLTEQGEDYMYLSLLLKLNLNLGRYMPRQEGALAPPEQAAFDAWQSLVAWDTAQHLQGSYVGILSP